MNPRQHSNSLVAHPRGSHSEPLSAAKKILYSTATALIPAPAVGEHGRGMPRPYKGPV